MKIAFFVVDTTFTTYNTLLGRDWIHQSLCVPSTLHQQLVIWHEEGFMEIVEAGPQPFMPFVLCFEARVSQNGCPYGVMTHKLIEEGLASSLEDWNRPCILNL
ncbi:unnamed protein product [Prunus armeniaca]